MSSPSSIMPRHDIAATGSNLLLLLAFCIMFLWFIRLCRTFYRLYRLNKAVSTDQVVRLQTSDLQADERSLFFGEMEMLWRTNLQQQLLRKRHIHTAVDVSELKVPFFIDKSSIEVQEDTEKELVGVNFRFRMTQRMAIQMYWQVKTTALRDLLSKVNREHLGVGGNVATTGTKKKRFFGQRYMSVNNRESTNLDPDPAGERAFEMTNRQSLEEASPSRSQAPYFADDQCAARSGLAWLTDAGCEAWVLFDNPDQCQVGLSAHANWLPPPPPPPPQPSAQLPTPAALDDERGAGEGGGEEGEAAGEGRGEGGAGPRVELDVVVEDIEDGERERIAADDVHTLVIAAQVMHDEAHGAGALEPAGEGWGKEGHERVKVVLVVCQLDSRPGASGPRKLQVKQQVVVSNRAAYVSKEIFGEQEDDDQEDCVICLTEPKDTTLLPCRHLCVCSSCFSQLNKCPVCRSTFTAYLRVPVKEAETTDEDGQPDAASPSTDAPVQGQS